MKRCGCPVVIDIDKKLKKSKTKIETIFHEGKEAYVKYVKGLKPLTAHAITIIDEENFMEKHNIRSRDVQNEVNKVWAENKKNYLHRRHK